MRCAALVAYAMPYARACARFYAYALQLTRRYAADEFCHYDYDFRRFR